jgi:hypothetical protein
MGESNNMPAELNSQTFPLKYLFKVLYHDGSTFEQSNDDKSQIDPKRSAFYDVLNSGKKIRSFGLFSQDGGRDQALVVDLIDGHFEHNGMVIMPGEILPGPAPLKLIYFRQHQHDFTATYHADGPATDQKEVDHRITYFIGWQCNINGKNYKQVLGVN